MMVQLKTQKCFFLCCVVMLGVVFFLENVSKLKSIIILSTDQSWSAPKQASGQRIPLIPQIYHWSASLEDQDKTLTSKNRLGANSAVTNSSGDCDCADDQVDVQNEELVMETDQDFLIPYFQGKNFSVQKGLGTHHDELDPVLEVPLLRYPPLVSLKCLPDEHRSQVIVISPRDRYFVGDRIQFRVDLFTGCGKQRHLGGDEIRLWLKSAKDNSSIAAKVTDLHNGSYVGETVLSWPGLTLVRVSLTYPREFLQMVIKLHHQVHSLIWITETFSSGNNTNEVSLCHPMAPIPGYAKTCNFTSANGGRPWFCGHPIKRGLNCSHRRSVNRLKYMSPLPVSALLRQLIARLDECCRTNAPDLRLIANEIKIDTKQGQAANPSSALPLCWTKSARESWEQSTPRGWLNEKANWRSRDCVLPEMTRETVARCLRNTSLLLLGDSNQRLLWYTLAHFLNCTGIYSIPGWHIPRLCQNTFLNTTIQYVSHALPFIVGSHTDLKPVPLPQALERALNYTSSGNDIIVVVHYYAHLTTLPVQVFREMVQEARKTVEKFLQSRPKTKFIMRGPHVFYQGNNMHAYIADSFAHWYAKIWKEAFEELSDRVWYLDTWDLTIASENLSIHPDPVVNEILKIIFGFVCAKD